MKSNKGFTLIEILAVVIILGLVMIIAIPNVTKYIMESRRTSYLVDAQRYVEAARQVVETNKISCNSKQITYYIPRVCLPAEKGQQSPYGEWKDLYVVVTYDGIKHRYYYASTDSETYGIKLRSADELKEEDVKHGIKKIKTDTGVGGRTSIRVFDSSCATYEDFAASKQISEGA